MGDVFPDRSTFRFLWIVVGVVEVVDEMDDDMAAAFRKMAALPMVVAPRDFYLWHEILRMIFLWCKIDFKSFRVEVEIRNEVDVIKHQISKRILFRSAICGFCNLSFHCPPRWLVMLMTYDDENAIENDPTTTQKYHLQVLHSISMGVVAITSKIVNKISNDEEILPWQRR